MPLLEGRLNIFGSGCTCIEGDNFTSLMVGETIIIYLDGDIGPPYNFTVDTVQDIQNLTLTTTDGIHQNVKWTCSLPDPPPTPEPLMLGCFCPGDTGVNGCELVALTWHISITEVPSSTGKVCVGTATLSCGVGGEDHSLAQSGGGTNQADISLNLAAYYPNWGSITLTVGGDSSLFQITADDGAKVFFTYWIDQEYLCVNPGGTSRTKHIISVDENTCGFDNPGRATVQGGGGSALYTMFLSTTLGGAAAFCAVTGFQPAPTSSTLDADNLGTWCLCVDGGTPPYFFAIVAGVLPCGQSLNEETGCIEGTPDFTCPGSETVTFMVVDSAGATAQVTCNIAQPCPGNSQNLNNWAA